MPMTRWGQLCIHIFFRPDDPKGPHHCHPYDFKSLIIWGWYVEEERSADGTLTRHKRRWCSFRRGEPAHKIVEVGGPFGICITLMWRTPDYRDWFLYFRDGAVYVGKPKLLK